MRGRAISPPYSLILCVLDSKYSFVHRGVSSLHRIPGIFAKGSNTQRIVDGCGMDLKAMIRHVSLEPVFFLFCVNLGLIMISTQDLYLTKACKVNLRLPEFVCDNLQNRDVKLGYYLQHGNQSGIILSIHQKLSNYYIILLQHYIFRGSGQFSGRELDHSSRGRGQVGERGDGGGEHHKSRGDCRPGG